MKKKINSIFSLSIVFLLLMGTLSCSDDNENDIFAPEIILGNETSTFLVKAGKTIVIKPQYKNAENAVFSWKQDGKIIGRDDSLVFCSSELKDFFINLDVSNEVGTSNKEIKISVLKLMLPEISLVIPEDGYKTIKDVDFKIVPKIINNENAKYSWTIDGQEVSTDSIYTVNETNLGNINLKLSVTNDDGKSDMLIPVKICDASELPFNWNFKQESYNMSTGRSIKLEAFNVQNSFDATFTWRVNGKLVKEGTLNNSNVNNPLFYMFNETQQGEYTVSCTMKNNYNEITKTMIVNVCPEEGTYYRPRSETSSLSCNKVYEFLAAPGQFVNQGYDCSTMQEACDYAMNNLNKEQYVSLGAWGGYIVVGFDHSIDNDGSYNIRILGNSFAGSSEPGIVWVMQDENGDGLPNDTWYELKGCETGKSTTIQNYVLTYTRPSAANMPTHWIDNSNNEGYVDYMAAFHSQPYYYPSWHKSDTLVFIGTCLGAQVSQDGATGFFYNGEYDWGYVDNYSPIDRLTTDDNYFAGANGNHFKISNAIDDNQQAIDLKYIDFVKIATGANVKAGWLGENSTEVFGVKDFNMIKENADK